MDMEIEPASSDLQPVSSSGSTGLTGKFPDTVDWKEFRERTIAQVMKSHIGRAPPDYFMADLAVTFWMQHFDKSPEELVQLLRETPLNPLPDPDEGIISIIDSEEPVTTLESAPSLPLLESSDSSSHLFGKSYKEALLTNLIDGHNGERTSSTGTGGSPSDNGPISTSAEEV
jgi:hypothetical protein